MSFSRRSLYGSVALGSAFLGCLAVTAATVLMFSFGSDRHDEIQSTGAPAIQAPPNKEAKMITVDARQIWVETNLQIASGDTLMINATCQVNVASPGNGADKWVDPDGWGYIPLFYCDGQPCRYVYRTPDSLGCLIAKIGGGKPFKVGSHYAAAARAGGTVYLSVNDSVSDQYGTVLDDSNAAAVMFSNNRGSFDVTIQILSHK